MYIRKISNSGELKVKIESVSDSIDSEIIENENISNKSIDAESKSNQDQELVIFNLISSDKSSFDISQLFGFLSNCRQN